MDIVYRQRKYNLALLFTVSSIIALFVDKISGGEFIGAMGVILALYGASNVSESYVTRTAQK